jgi:hypothetical protein
LAVAALGRRGQRRLLRWHASRCGARRHVRRLRRRRLGCRCAHSTQAAPASTLARVTVWRGAAHVLPQAVAAWLSLRSLSAGCSGFYAGARHNVARCCTCAASGSGSLAVAALARRWLRRLLRWCASRCDSKVPRVPPQAAAAWPLLRSFSASCAGFYAGARHGVARGGTCATSGGGGLAVAAPARRGLRRLLRWRASRCGAGQHMCCLMLRWLGRRCARSARAAPASTLARVTVWRRAAHVPAQAGGLAVAALARRGLRWLLRWRASRCGAR